MSVTSVFQFGASHLVAAALPFSSPICTAVETYGSRGQYGLRKEHIFLAKVVQGVAAGLFVTRYISFLGGFALGVATVYSAITTRRAEQVRYEDLLIGLMAKTVNSIAIGATLFSLTAHLSGSYFWSEGLGWLGGLANLGFSLVFVPSIRPPAAEVPEGDHA